MGCGREEKTAADEFLLSGRETATTRLEPLADHALSELRPQLPYLHKHTLQRTRRIDRDDG